MIWVAICDDVRLQLHTIHQAAEGYFSKRHEKVECCAYDNAFKLLDDIEQKGDFDIALLDICMPGILGTDVAMEMRRRKCRAEIIFITTSDEFAIEAFSLKAVHYLLKPFSQADFNAAMNRAMERLTRYHSEKIIFKLVGCGVQTEELDHIMYVESKGHILQIHLVDGTILEVRQTLTHLMEALDKKAPGQFVSPAKGYIVNQEAIHIIKSDYIEVQGKCIPLAKRKYREFQENYFKFIFMRNA
ncbi:histidine kinase [Megasphaera cerevisiae DSM 20462]|uniref:Histidine kinase n=1 Tax=Megasphaera cerevisiae DSM 20462 TaxID=1122219 RepID=A0A0J6ZNW6_9FIRM|nr:LytTR family DNA-binding domain-containing protein [Megasphaera cerevisiae]KMO86571.1 histidine kinase [Megasphaera cerevisiae DSM 20462]OKY53739.1 DNA-binding response regulator [Megasphaera cerevisiae]SJZ90526.1 two component transcriptional regulator, LytTR family [Megasphaera cerevisiae DSM 20462]